MKNKHLLNANENVNGCSVRSFSIPAHLKIMLTYLDLMATTLIFSYLRCLVFIFLNFEIPLQRLLNKNYSRSFGIPGIRKTNHQSSCKLFPIKFINGETKINIRNFFYQISSFYNESVTYLLFE